MTLLDRITIPGTGIYAGIDEAGRGPLAGPVIAAAVIFGPATKIEGLRDSKLLSEKSRTMIAVEIRERSLNWATGRAETWEIDAMNILQASLLAMQRAVESLDIAPEFALVDGPHCPGLTCPVEGVIKGDRRVNAISAASIIAKVTRDEEMAAMDAKYPGYGFARHKGYPTREHIRALEELGPCDIHRLSFGPVKLRLSQS